MSNKKLLADVFEEKYSSDKNYQAIMNRLDKKKVSKKNIYNYSLIPVLVVILVIINITFLSIGNHNIYINNLDSSKLPKTTMSNLYLSEEYNVSKDYPFVDKINVPTDINNKEEGIIYLDNNQIIEIHDYILAYYNHQNKRSVKIFFSLLGTTSLTLNPLEDMDLKTSKINGYEIVIASLMDIYYVNFEYQNKNIHIETNEITQEELINIIKSILK